MVALCLIGILHFLGDIFELFDSAGQVGNESAESGSDFRQVLLKELAGLVVAPYLLCLFRVLRQPVAQFSDALRDTG